MSATATIIDVFCVKEATGTDLGSLSAVIQEAFNSLLPRQLDFGVSPKHAIAAVTGLIEALDAARSDPDNLYITTATTGNLGNSVWPAGQQTVDILGEQSVQPSLALTFDHRLNVSLWDHDASSDDLLGSIQVSEDERGQGEITKFAYSMVESSAYYVTYTVE